MNGLINSIILTGKRLSNRPSVAKTTISLSLTSCSYSSPLEGSSPDVPT